MQFEKQQLWMLTRMVKTQLIYLEKLILRYQKNIGFMEKKDRELLYFDALVDSEPVDVKVIQRHKGCVEVSRDLDSNAGFW
jgi:hypothetical protein